MSATQGGDPRPGVEDSPAWQSAKNGKANLNDENNLKVHLISKSTWLMLVQTSACINLAYSSSLLLFRDDLQVQVEHQISCT